MSTPEGPARITGDLELDLALHAYMSSDAYREYDAIRTPAARQKLERSEAHAAYRRVIDAYLIRQMQELNRRR